MSRENFGKLRNITNGQIQLRVDAEDILPEDQKFSTGWQFEDSQPDDIALAKTSIYLENIRTGQFSEISDNYMLKNAEVKQHFTSDTFDSEMKDRTSMFTHVVSKVVMFFEGILAGMCILQLIVLKLTETIYKTQVFRVDQIIRISAFTSTFGSIFLLLNSYRAYNEEGPKKASVNEMNEIRKQYIGSIFSCLFYAACWVLLNVAHRYAIEYNLDENKRDPWSQFQIAYMVFALLGWLCSVITSKNYLGAS